MTDATELDLDAIRARLEAATEGPWDVVPMPRHPGIWDIWGVRPDEVIGAGETRVAEVRGYEHDAEFIAHARTDVGLLLTALEVVRAERDELMARLQQREAAHAARLAEEASPGDTGICRTCALPITFETVEEQGYKPRTGWSDRSRVDALVCFKAVDYRHVPLVGRERGVWDAAVKATLARAEAAEGAVAAVKALHQPRECRVMVARWEPETYIGTEDGAWCDTCNARYPCPTSASLATPTTTEEPS